MITQFYTICHTRHIGIHNVFLTYTAPAAQSGTEEQTRTAFLTSEKQFPDFTLLICVHGFMDLVLRRRIPVIQPRNPCRLSFWYKDEPLCRLPQHEQGALRIPSAPPHFPVLYPA